MRKVTLLLAAFIMAVLCANAQTINNPKDKNGYYIVKWDCEKETWAESNDFEVDEAFTFVIDITGTAFEDWVKQTPTNAGATRGIAINRWCGFGNFKDDINRLKQIKGNLYGATWCFSQAAGTFDVSLATVYGAITYFSMQIFGFEYTSDSPTVNGAWYINAIGIDGVDGSVFTSAPYTGTKTSVEFYCDDFEGFWPYTVGGYAPVCAEIEYAEVDDKEYALTINNPKDKNGYYIVKWDCVKEDWADSNDFEVDEAFTFAVDITGTALAEWIRTPEDKDGIRSIAVNKWSGFGDFNSNSNRLKRIKGNIYGTTWCFSQLGTTFKIEEATKADAVTYFFMQIFGFEYTADNPTVSWWQWPEGWLPVGTGIEAVEGAAFTSAAYTGTKTSEPFNSSSYEGFWPYEMDGYAPSCSELEEKGYLLTINNPKDEAGYFIMKWDCENDTWAASNDFEVDEAFTFAVDITGSSFEDWVKTPTNASGTRSIAALIESNFGSIKDGISRLRPIKENIYGATWCFTQSANDFDIEKATKPEEITYFYMRIFGFEYTDDNPTVSWWQWPVGWLPEGTAVDAVDGVTFTSAPYSGTKTSVAFSPGDFEGFWSFGAGGYAPTCAEIAYDDGSGIHPVINDSHFVRYEYFNLLGVKLFRQPESGLFIEKAIKADGTSVVNKVLKLRK